MCILPFYLIRHMVVLRNTLTLLAYNGTVILIHIIFACSLIYHITHVEYDII